MPPPYGDSCKTRHSSFNDTEFVVINFFLRKEYDFASILIKDPWIIFTNSKVTIRETGIIVFNSRKYVKIAAVEINLLLLDF